MVLIEKSWKQRAEDSAKAHASWVDTFGHFRFHINRIELKNVFEVNKVEVNGAKAEK